MGLSWFSTGRSARSPLPMVLAAAVFGAVVGFANPASAACLTSTLFMPPAPYTNTQCITPPSDNDGINATGSTYTLNNSGAITIQSTSPAPGGLGSQAIDATATGNLTVINTGALSATATGTGEARGISALQFPTATGTVTVMNSGPITVSASGLGVAVGISGGGGQTTNLTNSSTITATGTGNGLVAGIVADTGLITCSGGFCTATAANGVSNVTNTGSIVVNGASGEGIFVSTSSTTFGSANVMNLGTITVNGPGASAIGGFISTVPVVCPIATCIFGNGLLSISNAGTITAGPGAFLFFSFPGTNPLNQVTNTGTLDGQLRDPTIPTASFIQSDLTNSGLLTISYPGAGLAQIVDGKFTQTASGTLGLRINAAGQHDFLTAQSVSLAGTLLAINQPGTYANVTFYPGVVQSAAPITTKFDSVALANASAFFMATATYNPNTVDLTVTRQQFGLLPGLTFNERAVGAALETGFEAGAASGRGGALYTALFGLQNVQQAAFAYDQLSGEIYATAQTVMLDDQRYIRDAVLGRLRQAAFAGSGPLAALGAGGPMLAYAEPTDEALAYADAGRPKFPVKALPLAPTPEYTWWTQGVGAWGHIDGDGNAAAASRELAGAFTGVDRRLGDFWRVGLVGGFTDSSLNVSARASAANIDTGYFGAYAGATYGPWSLRSGATVGVSTISANRTILFPGFLDAAAARYDGVASQVFGEVGYAVALGRVAAEPFAGLAYVHLDTGSLTEAGGIAALTGKSATDDVGYSTLGARVATNYALANGMVLTPRASAAWQHAFGSLTPIEALAFQSTGVGFDIAGLPIARDAALVEAALDLHVTRAATLGISYVGQLASSAQDHSVKGNFTWKF